MYKLTQNQISSEMAGETVILNHVAGRYYGLDEVGTLVWHRLQQSSASFDELREIVLFHFNVDEQTCVTDLHELLADLTHENLVETV